jgi:hypothetical protein
MVVPYKLTISVDAPTLSTLTDGKYTLRLGIPKAGKAPKDNKDIQVAELKELENKGINDLSSQ